MDAKCIMYAISLMYVISLITYCSGDLSSIKQQLEYKESKLSSVIKIATEEPGGQILRSVGKESTGQSGFGVFWRFIFGVRCYKRTKQMCNSGNLPTPLLCLSGTADKKP